MKEELLKAIAKRYESAAGVTFRGLVGDGFFTTGSDISFPTPFVTLATPPGFVFKTNTSSLETVPIIFSVWDDNPSQLRALRVSSALQTLYTDVLLTLGGSFTMIEARFRGEGMLPDPDKGWHGIVNYEYQIGC